MAGVVTAPATSQGSRPFPAGQRLAELFSGDLAVRASLQFSYQMLPTDQQRAPRLLGLLDAPEITPEVAAAEQATHRHESVASLAWELSDVLVAFFPLRTSYAEGTAPCDAALPPWWMCGENLASPPTPLRGTRTGGRSCIAPHIWVGVFRLDHPVARRIASTGRCRNDR